MQMATHTPFSHLESLFQSTEGDLWATAYVPEASATTTQNDSEEEMWTRYMHVAARYDDRTARGWKEDAHGLLVFTSIFAAIVGAFIIEFYRNLLPDRGDRTVDILCQISQQLPNFANDSCSTPQTGQSFSPSASIIWVNAMWTTSLSFSLMSALFLMLLLRWTRTYVELPEDVGDVKHRARIRSVLLFGIQNSGVLAVVNTAPLLLHLSVFLFFGGLMILFYTIHKTVAIIVSVSVGIFVVAYVALTILPYIYHTCPYLTPMSSIWWYTSHLSILSISFGLYQLFSQIYSLIGNLGGAARATGTLRIIRFVMFTLKRAIKKHARRLRDGFQKTIVQGVLVQALDSVDVEALAWWLRLPALSEGYEAEAFFGCMPKQAVFRLMRHPTGKLDFLDHLLALLRTCQPGSPADVFYENKRLRVCLHNLYYITLDYVNPDLSDDISFVLAKFFEDIDPMQEMWTNSDADIRVTSRSLCALLARCLLCRRWFIRASELHWLQVVTGEAPDTISDSDEATRNNMNLKAFVYGVFAHQDGNLPAKQATCFTETLAILMDVGTQPPFDRPIFSTKLSALIAQIGQDTTEGGTRVAQNLGEMFTSFLPPSAPAAAPQP